MAVARLIASAAVCLAALLLVGCGEDPSSAETLHVSPLGKDAPGRGSPRNPLRSIQAAVEEARPGDTIQLAAGDYDERIVITRSGKPGAPITLAGSRGARISGDGSGRQIEILGDYVTLRGLTVADADKLVWVEHARHVVIEHNRFENAGGECIRVKYLSSDVRVAHNTIDHCGLTGFDLGADQHNGEGVYIGTDPGQLDRNPTRAPDTTNDVEVIDNTIATYAAECVDIKEAATHNRVIGNDCSHARDPKGSGLDARGNGNLFRGNVVTAGAGAGIRFGGYRAKDGVHNVAIDNIVVGNDGYGFLVLRQPQTRVCGNVVRQNRLGAVDVASVRPAARC